MDDLPNARPRDPTSVGPEVLPTHNTQSCSEQHAHTQTSPPPTTKLPQRRTNMVQPSYTLPRHIPDDYRVRQWRVSQSVSGGNPTLALTSIDPRAPQLQRKSRSRETALFQN